MSLLVDMVRGANTAAIRRGRLETLAAHGCGRACLKNGGEAERLIRRMVVQGLLTERTARQEVHMAVVATLTVCEEAAARLALGSLTLRVPVLQARPGGSGRRGGSGEGADTGARPPLAVDRSVAANPAQEGWPGGTWARQGPHKPSVCAALTIAGPGRGPARAQEEDDDPIDLCLDVEEVRGCLNRMGGEGTCDVASKVR